jgi:hypothetical protein
LEEEDEQPAILRRLPSSGMLRRVAPVGTDDSEESIASILTMKIIGELEANLGVTNNRSTQLASVVSCY